MSVYDDAAEAHWPHEATCRECALTDEDYAYMAATLDASGYQADLERALDALRAWVAWADANQEQIDAGLTLAAAHGQEYRGQTWIEPMRLARAVLADLTAETGETTR